MQAQTLANFWLAFNNDLKMIPVINKIDIREANVEGVQSQLNSLFDFQPEEILRISAKNGVNIDAVLDALLARCPPPEVSPNDPFKALIFDSWYDKYRGAIAMISVKAGSIRKGQKISSFNEGKTYEVLEVGILHPNLTPVTVCFVFIVCVQVIHLRFSLLVRLDISSAI